MKQLLKISEMMPYLPSTLKDAIHHVAKDTGNATDSLELHRHTHSEKAKVNELDPTSRKSLAYVSYRTQDRDDEIVIPKSLKLDEFRKYSSVLVNHNYSLLPVGSDEWIDADDFGIKALTVHADTGAGTMANVVWDLVRQGHLKGRSVGFVPTSFTKPGARDWDHVANQLQSNWKEFDKGRAEKSVSRIITGGVLLEHSFVSVPCNTDAELIGVVKSMNLDGRIIKQLGWEMKDGILVNKGGPGSGSWEGPGNPRFAREDEKYNTGAQRARDSNFGVGDKVKITGKVSEQGKIGIAVGFDKDGSFAKIRIGDKVHSYHNSDVSAVGEEEDNDEKSFHSRVVEKLESAPCVCDECGYVEKVVPGTKCPECKTGDMKPKAKEKAYEIRVVSKGGAGSGNFGHEGRPGEVGGSGPGGGSGGGEQNSGGDATKIPKSVDEVLSLARATQVARDEFKPEVDRVYHASRPSRGKSDNVPAGVPSRIAGKIGIVAAPGRKEKDEDGRWVLTWDIRPPKDDAERDAINRSMLGRWLDRTRGSLGVGPDDYRMLAAYDIDQQKRRDAIHAVEQVLEKNEKSFHSHAVEKPNARMPGGSFSACVLLMEDKGHSTESAKKICGALQAESGEKIYDVIAEEVINKEVKGKAYYTPCVCDECGAEADTNPGEPCEEEGCKGTMQAKKEKKEYTPEITVVKPAPSIKILFAPPSTDAIAEQVGEAVERALSRRTGKIM